LARDVKSNSKEFDFIYFASGEPHKNHLILIQAWCLLAEEGFRPSLLLTLDPKLFPALCDKISVLKNEFVLNLLNIGWMPAHELKLWCGRAGALIFPSRVESLGLPLIEARIMGMPILAPELDYVRDLVDPEETFDPESPRSISRAVKRHLRIPEKSLPLKQASSLIEKIRGWNGDSKDRIRL
jgi:glycosyltransferase involved in cell wall biosynthesis